MNVEQRCFVLVFSANGGMGREGKKFYSVLAENDNIETKAIILHQNVLVAKKISFLLMRSILLGIRRSRGKNVNQEEMNVANDIEKVNHYRKFTNSKTFN